MRRCGHLCVAYNPRYNVIIVHPRLNRYVGIIAPYVEECILDDPENAAIGTILIFSELQRILTNYMPKEYTEWHTQFSTPEEDSIRRFPGCDCDQCSHIFTSNREGV
jgi:hypothetical protein